MTKKNWLELFQAMCFTEDHIVACMDKVPDCEVEGTINWATYLKNLNDGVLQRTVVFSRKKEHVKKRGVYRIDFGLGRYYIGRSKYIDTRLNQHVRELQDVWREWTDDHYLRNVFQFLWQNPFLQFFEVTLLQECGTVESLVPAEQLWLDKSNGDPLCLNVGFKALSIHNEIEESFEDQRTRKVGQFMATRYHNAQQDKKFRGRRY
jgi:hypothetical protein